MPILALSKSFPPNSIQNGRRRKQNKSKLIFWTANLTLSSQWHLTAMTTWRESWAENANRKTKLEEWQVSKTWVLLSRLVTPGHPVRGALGSIFNYLATSCRYQHALWHPAGSLTPSDLLFATPGRLRGTGNALSQGETTRTAQRQDRGGLHAELEIYERRSLMITFPSLLPISLPLLTVQDSCHNILRITLLPEDTELMGWPLLKVCTVTQLKLLLLGTGRKGKESAQCLR